MTVSSISGPTLPPSPGPTAGNPVASADSTSSPSAAMAPAPSEPSSLTVIFRDVAIRAAVGAALGFGASLLSLPGIGALSAPALAAIAAGVGLVAGAVIGIIRARHTEAAYQAQIGQRNLQIAAVAKAHIAANTYPVPASAPASTKPVAAKTAHAKHPAHGATATRAAHAAAPSTPHSKLTAHPRHTSAATVDVEIPPATIMGTTQSGGPLSSAF